MAEESADFRNGSRISGSEDDDIPPDVANACAPFSENYNMHHTNRGTAVIFNHVYFSREELKPRYGSNKDQDNLKTLLKEELKFNVFLYKDKELQDIKKILFEVSQQNHTDSDCLVVVVLTHGDTGILYAKDKPYDPKVLWEKFDARNCPSLAGKPKLFFIQACRGDDSQEGHTLYYQNGVEEDSTSSYKSYTIPMMADFLIMYSTTEGFSSWRHPIKGSRLIQSLVKQLKEHYKKKDLLTILTYVNQEVAIGYGDKPNKQMSCFVSLLTRFLYFVNDE